MSEKALLKKSENFAYRIVDFCHHLKYDLHEYQLAGQLIRSGTSIGANVVEAQNSISKKEFVVKMTIAQKECGETMYWLRVIHHGKYLEDALFQSLYKDCEEIMWLFISILKSSKKTDLES